MKLIAVGAALGLACGCASPSVGTARDAAADASAREPIGPRTDAATSSPAIGQPFFVDGGGQAMSCESGSPPVAIDRQSSRTACWYAGSSCAGRGVQILAPFTLKGTVVSGSRTHGGCDLGTYALVYERRPSTLRLRVCESRPAPIDCPAMVKDGARWDIAPLLAASPTTKVQLLRP